MKISGNVITLKRKKIYIAARRSENKTTQGGKTMTKMNNKLAVGCAVIIPGKNN